MHIGTYSLILAADAAAKRVLAGERPMPFFDDDAIWPDDLSCCYQCGRSFVAHNLDRDHDDPDRCSECVEAMRQRHADFLRSSTFDAETVES